MNSILQKIAQHKQEEVIQAKKQRPLDALTQTDYEPTRDFIKSLLSKNPSIIAEIKKASPSKGIICENFNVEQIARIYEKHGASCLSVLTDIKFFLGHPENISLAKKASLLPVLRKDFIVDSYQIYESRALGADCILLIVALLSHNQLKEYCQLAQELNMAVLVESHTQEELELALGLPTPLMGINNRSLHSFITDLNTTIILKDKVPKDKIIITESGVNTYQDVIFMQEHGISHFLIGESLMRCNDIGAKLDELRGYR